MRYKDTSIGRIPMDWEVKNLDEVTKINQESRNPSKISPKDKFLYIDIESITNESGIIKNVKNVMGVDAPLRARRVVHNNDVIMSTVRPYLKAFAIVTPKYDNEICSTGFAVLTAKKVIYPHYLLYCLFSDFVLDQCNRMMTGGQYPALNTSQVKKIKIPIPSLPEQKQISQIISTADQLINISEEILYKIQYFRKGLMQNLLTKGIGHNDFKDTYIGKIPTEWKLIPLKEIVEIQGGYPFKSKDYTEIGIPLVRIANVSFGRMIFEDLAKVPDSYLEDFSDYALKKGDVIMALTRPITGGGIKAGQIERVHLPALLNQRVGKLRILDEHVVSDKFLFWTIFSPNFVNQMKMGLLTMNQPNISTKQIGEFKIPLPNLQEQNKIAEILSKVDQKNLLEQRRRQKYQNIKNGLMKDLLTGRKRVKVTISG